MMFQNFRAILPCVIAVLAHGLNQERKYKVLMLTSPVATKSHSIYLNVIAREIASRGHQVTFRSLSQFESTSGVTTHVFKSEKFDNVCHKLFFGLTSVLSSVLMFFDIFPKLVYDVVAATYKDPMITELITRNGTTNYDLAIVDALFSYNYLPLVSYLGIPSIQMFSVTMLSAFAWEFDCPYHYHNVITQHPYHIDNRPLNFFSNIAQVLFYNWFVVPAAKTAIGYHAPQLQPFLDSEDHKSSMLISSSSILQNPMPSTPNAHHLECAQCRQPRKLPLDLELIVSSSSEHGLIYFTMGSHVQSNWLPEGFTNKLVKVLSGLQQKIIWKGQLDGHPSLSNFYFGNWIPQQDLLAHPNVRLVITHGGLGTVQEASYHGCPILGIPLSIDQYYNIHYAHKNGYAEKLDWKTFDEKELQTTINNIINNSRYKHMAMLASKRIRDDLLKPTEAAAYWIEYVTRHKGAHFLKNPAYNLNLFQYFLCDVIAVLIVAFTLLFTLVCLILKASLSKFARCYQNSRLLKLWL